MVVVVKDGTVIYVPTDAGSDLKQSQMLKDSILSKYLPIAAKIRQKSVSAKLLEVILREDSSLGGLIERYPNLLNLLDASVSNQNKAQIVRDFFSSGVVIPNELKNKLVALSQEIQYTTRFGAPVNFSRQIENSLDKINKVLGHDIYDRLLNYNLVSANIPELVNGVFTAADIVRLNEAGVSELEVRNLLKAVMPDATDAELDSSLKKSYDEAQLQQTFNVDNSGEELPVPPEVIGDPDDATNLITTAAATAAAEPQESMVEGGQTQGNFSVPVEGISTVAPVLEPQSQEVDSEVANQAERIMGKEHAVSLAPPDNEMPPPASIGPGPKAFNPLKPDVPIIEDKKQDEVPILTGLQKRSFLQKRIAAESRTLLEDVDRFHELLGYSLEGNAAAPVTKVRELGQKLVDELNKMLKMRPSLKTRLELTKSRDDLQEMLAVQSGSVPESEQTHGEATTFGNSTGEIKQLNKPGKLKQRPGKIPKEIKEAARLSKLSKSMDPFISLFE